MTTALKVIRDALVLLGEHDSEAPLQPDEAQDGLTGLNDMMAEWEELGIHTGFIPIADVDDQVIVPDYAMGAIKSKLAIYIAPEYNGTVTDALFARAKSSFTNARAALVRLQPSHFPDTLPRGSGNENGSFSRDGDSANPDFNGAFYPDNVKRNF